MKTTLILAALLLCSPLFAIQKEFSSKTTFPFEGGGYKIRGVPKNVIFLTIDDGPTPQGTPAMLDVLEDHQVLATFFVHGNQAAQRGSMLERMYRQGHLVANHAFAHTLDFSTSRSFLNSLLTTDQLIGPYILPESVKLFRSPGGVWNGWRAQNGNSNRILKKYVGPLFWNVGGGTPGSQDDADWKCWRRGNGVTVSMCADSYYRQILRNYRLGQSSLVLLHDIKALSARMVDRLLKKLAADNIKWEFRLADDMPIIKEYSKR